MVTTIKYVDTLTKIETILFKKFLFVHWVNELFSMLPNIIPKKHRWFRQCYVHVGMTEKASKKCF